MERIAIYLPWGNGFRKWRDAENLDSLGSIGRGQWVVKGQGRAMDEFISKPEMERLEILFKPEQGS